MKIDCRSVIRAVALCIGWLIAVLIFFTGLTIIGEIIGVERFGILLLSFTIYYSLAFGLGAAFLADLRRKPKIWLHALAFGIGGVGGGLFFVLAMETINQYESQLLDFTKGSSLSAFLLITTILSLLIPYLIGRVLLVGDKSQ